jgi:hypothetical protein
MKLNSIFAANSLNQILKKNLWLEILQAHFFFNRAQHSFPTHLVRLLFFIAAQPSWPFRPSQDPPGATLQPLPAQLALPAKPAHIGHPGSSSYMRRHSPAKHRYANYTAAFWSLHCCLLGSHTESSPLPTSADSTT